MEFGKIKRIAAKHGFRNFQTIYRLISITSRITPRNTTCFIIIDSGSNTRVQLRSISRIKKKNQ